MDDCGMVDCGRWMVDSWEKDGGWWRLDCGMVGWWMVNGGKVDGG